MSKRVTDEGEVRRQIEAEQAEINAIELKLSSLHTSYQLDAAELKKQLSDQHETLGKIIRYATKLESQIKHLKENVHYLNNLHKHNIH
ncbi:MAG: hypothetical protein WBB45_10380 [Cyclobacteriaceae bacterium]